MQENLSQEQLEGKHFEEQWVGTADLPIWVTLLEVCSIILTLGTVGFIYASLLISPKIWNQPVQSYDPSLDQNIPKIERVEPPQRVEPPHYLHSEIVTL